MRFYSKDVLRSAPLRFTTSALSSTHVLPFLAYPHRIRRTPCIIVKLTRRVSSTSPHSMHFPEYYTAL